MLDKLKVSIAPVFDPVTGEVIDVPAPDDLYDEMQAAGWSSDPGTGKAILLPDGREVVSPMPVAPPIGYQSEPSIMDRLSQMLEARLATLGGDDVLDESDEEANDFDVPDPEDLQPRSVYEIELLPEAPALREEKPAVSVEVPASVPSSSGGPDATV